MKCRGFLKGVLTLCPGTKRSCDGLWEPGTQARSNRDVQFEALAHLYLSPNILIVSKDVVLSRIFALEEPKPVLSSQITGSLDKQPRERSSPPSGTSPALLLAPPLLCSLHPSGSGSPQVPQIVRYPLVSFLVRIFWQLCGLLQKSFVESHSFSSSPARGNDLTTTHSPLTCETRRMYDPRSSTRNIAPYHSVGLAVAP